ncbi:MAG TPA: MFS transporter [Burkholderiales bacterium]|nr:MFS transporter [Burkholderiales bacterium]
MASALAYRDFRWLWTSSLLSWSSQWIQQAALGWVVYEITGSGALLGAVMGARAIPMFLLAPLSGVAAERYNRRRLLQGSQALAAAVSLSFGAALALGIVDTWMLFGFTVIMGAANVMDRPARLTTAFELVPRGDAVKAVAMNTMGFSMMRIFGPALAGYLIGWLGAAGSFFIQGTLYAASGCLVLMVVFPPRRPAPVGRSALAEMLEGFRYAASDPRTRMLVLLGALPYFLLVPVWSTLLPIYAKDVFVAGPQGLGMLLTGVGIGGTLGGLAANALARAERQALIQAGWIVLMGVAILGLAASPTIALAMVFAVIGGAAEMAHTASNMAMMQMNAPEEMRGRISSLTMLYPSMISVGAFVAGPISDLLGVRGASVALAATAIAAMALLYSFSPQLREMRFK